ncbi:Dual-specificity RNA methyltransferase RlmN [Buchnera aphidicola (Anoecia corni)]|uniref:Dual-specificity RNA methyltransferase RlmN n=1 Tax=Buchnera aphidicola (Anoecia corni) TaxID=2994477 RepID=A0AAT9IGR2_9GAMM
MINKINLLDLDKQQMYRFFLSIGEKQFRVNQIMNWIYKYYCNDFNKMTNLNLSLKKKLNDIACIYSPKFLKEQISLDGTIKWSVEIGNKLIETIYIPEKKRSTICVSSQIGCVLKCKFCSTGYQGFNGNLSISEIIGQIWNASRIIKNKSSKKNTSITNIVFMGMGEPLLNIKNLIPALKIITDSSCFNISKRRVTVSTSGIVSGLKILRNTIDVNLAISLHASNDKIRNLIMPINKKYSIESILSEVRKYLKTSKANHGGVTIEYVMLKNINDSLNNAKELAVLLKNIPSKINLIPWNHFIGTNYKSSSYNTIINFSKILKKQGFITTIRKNRGEDIKAACGQLVGKM